MMKRNRPALVFSPTGRHEGFNAKAMSSVDDLQPTRFVRELLQNSLDAGVEANREVVHVRFKVTPIQGTEIPDLDGYERVLDAAVQTHGEAAERAREIVDRMRTAIDDGKPGGKGLWCLSILDNGIGLDNRRMTAILGDGAPQKDEDALGSFGVGHFAPIATSDLRYALYGGVHMQGRRRCRIASGMAVLASHQLSDAQPTGSRQAGQVTLRGGCGQLAANQERGKDGTHKALTRNWIPDLVGRELDAIADSWGHGTAVVIPAFNYFNADADEESYLHRLVPKVAAYNFHPAIEAGRLVIEVDETGVVEDGENGQVIVDKNGLRRVLEEDQHRVRSFRADGFHAGLRPSGRHAHSAWRTKVEGTDVLIRTAAGKVTARILVGPPCGGFRVDLFRDGMWITDNLPGLQGSDFSDRKPFHAVLLLDRDDGGQLLDIINKAEGPDHNSLDLGRLSKKTEEKARLLKLLRGDSGSDPGEHPGGDHRRLHCKRFSRRGHRRRPQRERQGRVLVLGSAGRRQPCADSIEPGKEASRPGGPEQREEGRPGFQGQEATRPGTRREKPEKRADQRHRGSGWVRETLGCLRVPRGGTGAGTLPRGRREYRRDLRSRLA